MRSHAESKLKHRGAAPAAVDTAMELVKDLAIVLLFLIHNVDSNQQPQDYTLWHLTTKQAFYFLPSRSGLVQIQKHKNKF